MPRRHRRDEVTKSEKLQRQLGVGAVHRGVENEVRQRSSAIGLSRRRAWPALGLGEKLEMLPEPRG